MRIAGAVLCGGASRRMGRDKALIDIDGVPMAERVARAVEDAGCAPVVFVGGDERALRSMGRPFVADRWPGEGPVGGVLSALSALVRGAEPVHAVLAVACDLLDLTPAAVREVAGAGPIAVDVRVADSGRLEPLLACWRVSALTPALAAFERGVRAMHEVLAELAVERVSVDRAIVRNANSPGDLGH